MSTIRLHPKSDSHHASPRLHGILDYVGGAALLLAAIFLPFPDSAMRMISAVLGTVLLLYSAGTDYEVGLLRFIPFPIHRGADLIMGVTLAFSPIHFGVHGLPTIVFLAVGIMLVVLAFLTPSQDNSNTGSDRPILPGA